MINNKKQNVKGYSLLEMLVTLVVFAILMTMVIQVLLLSINSGRKISARSKVRGDLSEIAVMIRRDIRNAGKIDQTKCSDSVTHHNPNGSVVVSDAPACFFNLSGNNYAWVYGVSGQVCPENKLCKLKQNSSNNYEIFYQSSDALKFEKATTRFEVDVYQDNETGTQGIVLASLTANASDDIKVEVATQYRQITIFTRNF